MMATTTSRQKGVVGETTKIMPLLRPYYPGIRTTRSLQSANTQGNEEYADFINTGCFFIEVKNGKSYQNPFFANIRSWWAKLTPFASMDNIPVIIFCADKRSKPKDHLVFIDTEYYESLSNAWENETGFTLPVDGFHETNYRPKKGRSHYKDFLKVMDTHIAVEVDYCVCLKLTDFLFYINELQKNEIID